MERKRVRIDWKGNESITTSWGALSLPKHLNAFGRPNGGGRVLGAADVCKLALIIAVVAALMGVLFYFAGANAVHKP